MKILKKGGGTGQGALEYLIIVAAVLAIAAIVVLFLTGAFQSTNQDITACKLAASTCATELATSNNQAECTYCADDCDDTMGYNDEAKDANGVFITSAIEACEAGLPEAIFQAA